MAKWPGLPIGMENVPSYMKAVERAQGQCEQLSSPRSQFDKPKRCSRTFAGRYKLFLSEAGQLLCQQHFDKDRLERKKAKAKL